LSFRPPGRHFAADRAVEVGAKEVPFGSRGSTVGGNDIPADNSRAYPDKRSKISGKLLFEGGQNRRPIGRRDQRQRLTKYGDDLVIVAANEHLAAIRDEDTEGVLFNFSGPQVTYRRCNLWGGRDIRRVRGGNAAS